jgi:hypothetical protein
LALPISRCSTDSSFSPQAGNARKSTGADQPSGFGELGGGTLGLAVEAISRREVVVRLWYARTDAARLLEPDDRLADARLQQMDLSNPAIAIDDVWIARIEADALLQGFDCLLHRTGHDLTNANPK